MECFAAYLSYTDAQIGRVLDYLEETGDLDNTVIVAVLRQRRQRRRRRPRFDQRRALCRTARPAGRRELRARIDELGGPTTHNNYPWGWTMAGNTPFKRWKREVHEGGVADPCIVRLPPALRGAAAPGGIRHQFAHAIDVLPTVLELAGIAHAAEVDGVAQSPIDGTSFALRAGRRRGARTARHAVLRDARLARHLSPRVEGRDVPRARRTCTTTASTPTRRSTTTSGSSTTSPTTCRRPTTSRRRNRSGSPTMIELWWDEARRNDVLPLDNRPLEAILHPAAPPRAAPAAVTCTGRSARPFPRRRPCICRTASTRSPRTSRSAPHGVAEGILLAMGSALGGFAFYLRDGSPALRAQPLRARSGT